MSRLGVSPVLPRRRFCLPIAAVTLALCCARAEARTQTSHVQHTAVAAATASVPAHQSPHVDINLPPVDSALLSVLNDIAKAAGSNEELDKIEDPSQKAAVKSALDALNFAVAHAQVSANRIVANGQKEKLEKTLTAESWESGLVPLPGEGQASLNVLWAKKVNGLINVSVVGSCDCKGEATPHIGEYTVVFNGKAVLDSGFDIQSQSDVSFWLGKLTLVSADATKCGEGQTQAGTSVPVLKALVTGDRVHREAAMALREKAAQEKVAREQERATVEQVVRAQTVNPGEITPAPVPAEVPVAQTPAAAPSPAPEPVQTASRPIEAASSAASSASSSASAPPHVVPGPGLMYLPELKPPMNVPEQGPAAQ